MATMDVEIFFRVLTAVCLVSAVGISSYFRRRADQQGGQLRSQAGGKLLVGLRLFGLLAILPLLGYLFVPDWVAWARVSLPDWLRWLGALVAVAMLPMIYWVLVSIGNNISPVQVTRENHKLVTDGPYRYVRHPLYSVGLAFILALSVMTGLWWLAVGVVLAFVVLWLRTAKEEAWLIETFGDTYRDYMRRTGRFLPKLG
jgi:protein-S-isoprenylcysteine O-methyltransferase Ste14